MTCQMTASAINGSELAVASTSVRSDWRENRHLGYDHGFVLKNSVLLALTLFVSSKLLQREMLLVDSSSMLATVLTFSKKKLSFC